MTKTEPSLDSKKRRDMYRDALEIGRHLASLLDTNVGPPPVHPPLTPNYTIDYGDTDDNLDRMLGPSAYRVARVEGFTPERISWCEVYSRHSDTDEPITLAKSDSHSGLFIVSELERKRDKSIPGTESRMSELLWHSYMEDATRQARPPTLLRRIWVDTVINEET